MSKSPTYKELQQTYANGYPCPEFFSFPSNIIDFWAAKDPSLLAIQWASHDYSSERQCTYAELSESSHRAAVFFTSLGIKKGDRVMIQLPRIIEWWVVVFGLMRIGAVPIPGTSLLVSKELKYRAQASGAVAFVGDSEAAPRFEEISKEVGISTIIQVRTENDGGLGSNRLDFQTSLSAIPKGRLAPTTIIRSNDLAIIFFTSGHRITGEWYQMAPGGLLANFADQGWAKGSWSTFGCFNLGGALFVQPPPPGQFNPTSVIDLINRYPITTLCAPPTIYRALCSKSSLDYFKNHPPKALRHACSAGEPLNPSVIKEWYEASGIEVKEAYGQSETIVLAGNFNGEKVKHGSMGKAAPGFTLGIFGPKGELKVGEEGELCVRTDIGGGKSWIFKGYMKDGKIDTREITVEGKKIYATGDRAFVDSEGYYNFVGRADDVISTSGYRVGPFEVESCLKEHPAVAESAAVASPDTQRGEIVKAFIILTPEYAAKLKAGGRVEEEKLILEIQTFCRKNASPYKYPRKIEFVTDLPKTVSGKIRRIELRNAEYAKHAKGKM